MLLRKHLRQIEDVFLVDKIDDFDLENFDCPRPGLPDFS
jgi:hypothetical protein